MSTEVPRLLTAIIAGALLLILIWSMVPRKPTKEEIAIDLSISTAITANYLLPLLFGLCVITDITFDIPANFLKPQIGTTLYDLKIDLA
jgi:hypothetical protein